MASPANSDRVDGSATAPVLLATAEGAWILDDDAGALLAALERLDIHAAPAVWDDPSVNWGAAHLVVVRSTWDYALRRDEFLSWADRVDGLTRLFNPAHLLRWNTDKRYLAELSEAGLVVVDTVFLDPGADPADISAAWSAHESAGRDWVVKPSVSAGSRDTERFAPGAGQAAASLVARIAASGRTSMVQPYLESVDEVGETGLVYFGGEFSHAFSKAAMLPPDGGPSAVDNAPTALFHAERIGHRTPTRSQQAVGASVMDHLVDRFGTAPLYARVDLLGGDRDDPVLLELELTEPSWFLATDPGAADRAAAAISRAMHSLA